MDIYLANPRGFCAGVCRALDIVQKALKEYGAPVYVRHEIVHNKHIVEKLQKQGVVFIENISEAATNRPLIFSAHGVSLQVRKQALSMNLQIIDATCPLVETVHRRIKELEKSGAEIIVIGKISHIEVIGIVGQVQNLNKVHIVSDLSDAKKIDIPYDAKVGIVTQTTLSVDTTKEIIDYLNSLYPNLIKENKGNICFATTNRQRAVRELVKKTKNIFIIGSKNSSNSNQLRETASNCGANNAWLIDDVSEIDWQEIDNLSDVGVSAGASAPEYLVENLLTEFKNRYNNVNIHNVIMPKGSVNF